MLFDEHYQEKFYRIESVAEALKDMDTLLLIGTAFQTSLARRMVMHSLWNKKNIIELNKESCLKKVSFFGNVVSIEEPCENVLHQIIE